MISVWRHGPIFFNSFNIHVKIARCDLVKLSFSLFQFSYWSSMSRRRANHLKKRVMPPNLAKRLNHLEKRVMPNLAKKMNKTVSIQILES